MGLDFSPLDKAISRLDEGLERYRRDTSDAQIRDGLIQRFEFTYDLAHKMLRRVLEERSANPEEVDRMPFADLIRTAFEQGLTATGWPQWRTFREMRNITSRAYDETAALPDTAATPDFIAEARTIAARSQTAAVKCSPAMP